MKRLRAICMAGLIAAAGLSVGCGQRGPNGLSNETNNGGASGQTSGQATGSGDANTGTGAERNPPGQSTPNGPTSGGGHPPPQR